MANPDSIKRVRDAIDKAFDPEDLERLRRTLLNDPMAKALYDLAVHLGADAIKYELERDEWKRVARNAGVCMSCALGPPDPYGCTDCLNTGWEQGAPVGFVPIPLPQGVTGELLEISELGMAPREPVSDRPITQAEMVEMFGDTMPMEAVELLSDPAPTSMAQLRNKLKGIAQARK